MQIKEVIKNLENNSEFKEWKEKNKDDYLAHMFKMLDNENKGIWQIGYASNENKVTTFVIDEDLKIVPDEEVFQEKKKQVKELNLDKVKIDFIKALKLAEEFQKEKCKGNEPAKIMLILQNIADNIVYNITYITITFNTLNIKIDAINGELISHEITPMLQFQGKSS